MSQHPSLRVHAEAKCYLMLRGKVPEESIMESVKAMSDRIEFENLPHQKKIEAERERLMKIWAEN